MPYVGKYEREEYDVATPNTPGQLNYTISRTCHEYIIDHGVSYSTLNEVIGVLECAKLELYRQVVAPYEDTKKTQNGAVSNLDA